MLTERMDEDASKRLPPGGQFVIKQAEVTTKQITPTPKVEVIGVVMFMQLFEGGVLLCDSPGILFCVYVFTSRKIRILKLVRKSCRGG